MKWKFSNSKFYQNRTDCVSFSSANDFNLTDLVSQGRQKTDLQTPFDKPVEICNLSRESRNRLTTAGYYDVICLNSLDRNYEELKPGNSALGHATVSYNSTSHRAVYCTVYPYLRQERDREKNYKVADRLTHTWRIELEDKAKVVKSDWGTESLPR